MTGMTWQVNKWTIIMGVGLLMAIFLLHSPLSNSMETASTATTQAEGLNPMSWGDLAEAMDESNNGAQASGAPESPTLFFDEPETKTETNGGAAAVREEFTDAGAPIDGVCAVTTADVGADEEDEWATPNKRGRAVPRLRERNKKTAQTPGQRRISRRARSPPKNETEEETAARVAAIRKSIPCREFSASGTCRFGEECFFKHDAEGV